MEVIIENKKHTVVYIEYQDGIPFSVITMYFVSTAKKPYWRAEYWDFFKNDNDIEDIKAYSSGSGGDPFKINAPKYMNTYSEASYWMDKRSDFDGIPENIKKLDNPILLNESLNPFDYSEITYSCEYCDRCEYYSTEFCHEHKYEDDNGNVKYKDDHSYE